MRDLVRNAKTESGVAMTIGIWIVALGLYSFVLFLANLADIDAVVSIWPNYL